MSGWLINISLVFIGGGIGSALRYGVGKWMISKIDWSPILATFSVNVVGSLLLGFLFAWVEKNQPTSLNPLWLLLGVGFCGGFTTFSTFALENINLIKDGNFLMLFTYSLGSLAAGFLLAWVAIQLVG